MHVVAVRVEDDDGECRVEEQPFEQHPEGVGLAGTRLTDHERVPSEARCLQHHRHLTVAGGSHRESGLIAEALKQHSRHFVGGGRPELALRETHCRCRTESVGAEFAQHTPDTADEAEHQGDVGDEMRLARNRTDLVAIERNRGTFALTHLQLRDLREELNTRQRRHHDETTDIEIGVERREDLNVTTRHRPHLQWDNEPIDDLVPHVIQVRHRPGA